MRFYAQVCWHLPSSEPSIEIPGAPPSQTPAPSSADLRVSRQAIIRCAKGEYKISHAREMQILAAYLKRTRAVHVLVRAMVRRAAAAERA